MVAGKSKPSGEVDHALNPEQSGQQNGNGRTAERDTGIQRPEIEELGRHYNNGVERDMTFKYKVRRIPRKPLPFGTIAHENIGESLSGYVNGADASDLEERFSRALNKSEQVSGYLFRDPVISPRYLPGQLEVDFVVESDGVVYPFQIDGEFAHKNMSKKLDDARKDVLVNEYLKTKYNAMPVKRIPGDDLQTQDDANRLVMELLR